MLCPAQVVRGSAWTAASALDVGHESLDWTALGEALPLEVERLVLGEGDEAG